MNLFKLLAVELGEVLEEIDDEIFKEEDNLALIEEIATGGAA